MARRLQRLLASWWSSAPSMATSRTTSQSFWADLHPQIAEYPQPKKTVWLDQNVSKEKLSWFYHADQGTRTFGIPYEWFMALEQPAISLVPFASPGMFSDPAYLDRYGFIPDTIIPGKTRTADRLCPGRPDAGPVGRAVAQPEQQTGNDRHRPDLRRLSHRTLHLQGHRRRDRRRTGTHHSLRDEAGNGCRAADDARGTRPLRSIRRPYPGPDASLDDRADAEIPARPGPESVRASQGPGAGASARRAFSKATDGSTR